MLFWDKNTGFSHYRYKIPLRKLKIRMRRQKLHIGYENNLHSPKWRFFPFFLVRYLEMGLQNNFWEFDFFFKLFFIHIKKLEKVTKIRVQKIPLNYLKFIRMPDNLDISRCRLKLSLFLKFEQVNTRIVLFWSTEGWVIRL